MALDTFNPYLFVSSGEQSNKFLTPVYADGIAKFQAQRAQQVNKLLVQFDPVQDLNGQANPYPGGGGKNIMPVSPVNRSADPSITTDGDVYTINGTATGYIQSPADTAFTLSAGDYYFRVFTISGTGHATAQLRSTDGLTTYATVVFSDIPISSGAAFNLAEDTEVKFRIVALDATFANLKIQCMVSKGTTAPTAYAPYSNICPISGRTGLTVTVQGGETERDYPISWQTEAGAIYGGTLDVVSGVLTVTDAQIASYAGETLPGEWISDRDVYAAGTTPTTGAQVVYKLATPQTYQLTPTEVQTIPGFNQIYSDAGPVIDIKF